MNKYIKIALFSIIILYLVFLSFKNYLDNKNNINKAIFDIMKEQNIDLDYTKLQNYEYKNIENHKKVGNGFFINKNGEFLTSKHVLNNNSIEYFIKIENQNYNFDIIKTYQNKDIILGKIKNYKNENFLKPELSEKLNLVAGGEIFIIKDNKKIYGKILETNQKIDEFKLDSLIKTNIKLFPGDSGSPLFNISGEIIGINSAINKLEDTSFAQTIE